MYYPNRLCLFIASSWFWCYRYPLFLFHPISYFGLIRHNSFGWIVNHFNDDIEHQDQISEEGDHNEDNTLDKNFDVMNLMISCDPRRRKRSGLLKSKNWMPSYEIKKLNAERGSRILYGCERIESQIERNGKREGSNQENSWLPNGGVLDRDRNVEVTLIEMGNSIFAVNRTL